MNLTRNKGFDRNFSFKHSLILQRSFPCENLETHKNMREKRKYDFLYPPLNEKLSRFIEGSHTIPGFLLIFGINLQVE